MEWRKKNYKRQAELNRAYYARTAESQKKRAADWAAANQDRKRATDRAWKEKNEETIRVRSKAFRTANAEELKRRKREHYRANREAMREKCRIWRKANHGKVIASAAARKRRIRQAMPKWLSKDQRREIRQYYENAVYANEALGAVYHVDHIIPITHPLVCGLHVPWNLQLLTAEENVEKSNRFDGWG